MRIFKKKTVVTDTSPPELGPRIEDDVVYDENGDVLYNHDEMSADAEPDFEVAPMPEPEAVAEAILMQENDSTADTMGFDDDEEGVADSIEIELPDDIPTVDVAQPRAETHVEPSLLHKRVNLGELRMDVARITSDIQSGERLYHRAQQRVESLMQFVERAEVDFSLLNRLEPENRRLKARNRVLEAENDASAHDQRRLENDLAKSREEAEQAKANLEATRTRLSAVNNELDDRNREANQLAEKLEQAGLKLERTQTSVDVESRENVVLRDQITDLSGRLDDVTSERMELAKIVESLKIDCDDFRAQREQALSEVSDLRVALATAQKVNGEMKTQMVSLHEEIKGFKTQYEFNVISREDRIANLENRIADLTKQLSIKDDVSKNALADVAQLRKARSAQDLERERLERVIETQQRQLDEAQAQIQRSTDSMAQLDQRYNDVSEALSVYQKRLSAAGAEVSDRDWAEPLSPPPPFEAEDTDASDKESITPENVEDMIMDYKLGLRSQLG